MKYPNIQKDTVVDVYFGEKVPAPYRWLEDDNSAQTKKWVQAENAVTFGYLDKIPFRNELKKQITDRYNYEKIGAPFVEGNYTYFFKNDGLQAQTVLYRFKTNDPNKVEEIFLDPNLFSKDGTTSLGDVSFSKDGSLAAYQISEGGSDWRKVIVLETAGKKQIGDTLLDVKFSNIAWRGNDGFYYSSYDKPKEGSQLAGKTEHHKLFYHKLNTPQSEDPLIFGGEETPRRYITGIVSEDQQYLIISASNTTSGNELYVQSLVQTGKNKIAQVFPGFDNNFEFITSNGDDIYIQTNWNAPNGQLIKFDFNVIYYISQHPNDRNVKMANPYKTVIPEDSSVLSVSSANQTLFAQYITDVHSEVKQYDLNGKLIRSIDLPADGQAGGFRGKDNQKEIYYTFTNYVYPSTIFKYNTETGESVLYRKPKINFNPDDFESKQVFYTSKDGTRIPMYITYKKGIKLDGKNPTILYGYGGFNASLLPSFSVINAVWLQNGGIYAVPNLRGGGEYGRKWHDAGIKMNKKNVFEDFIAAGEYLIKNGYTSSDYLALSGGSNGGLLVGATMTMRPDLAKVALPAVGVMDMLRYHKFTAGAGWAYDYGTADDSREMFEYLKSYSPVHNVKQGVCYPATLITTGDHDDRVVPSHSYKFAAELQTKQGCGNPVLIRIETRAGHGAGKSTEQIIDEAADRLSFALWNMGVKNVSNIAKNGESSSPANPKATPEAKQLFSRLMELQKRGTMYGHQDDLMCGFTWWSQPGRSDTKEAVGDYPAIAGFEMGEIERGGERSLDSVSFAQITQQVKWFHKKNGIVTVSWHVTNPITSNYPGKKEPNGAGSAWDVKMLSADSLNAVKSVLPGGENHEQFNRWLTVLANYFLTWKDDNGKLIPFIFRPFHEHSGSFFWWGDTRCTDEEYAELWRYTVNFLREKGLNNILFAYNTDKVYSLEQYLRGYPGDEYVDVISIDWYGSGQEFNEAVDKALQFTGEYAKEKNKIHALSECGPVSSDLLQLLKKHNVSFLLTWRNRPLNNLAELEKLPDFNEKTESIIMEKYAYLPNKKMIKEVFNDPHYLFLKDIQDVDTKASKVDKSIRSGRYEITVNQVNPMAGGVRHLTPDYSVRIAGDSAYVYLPYFGRAYSAPYGGDGGVKVSGLMDNYKVDYKKGKNYSIDFSAKGTYDTFRFSITVWTNGSTSINVTSNNRQAISYMGELKEEE